MSHKNILLVKLTPNTAKTVQKLQTTICRKITRTFLEARNFAEKKTKN